MKIVNLDGVTTNPGDLSWDGMKKLGDFTVYDRTSPDQIIERAKGANALIINKTILTKEILEQLKPELEYVGLQSTGYNVVDCESAKKLGITVCNIPSYSTNAVAQLVFSFILQFTNKVSLHSEAVHNGEWCSCPDFCFWKAPLAELAGKTIGIIGFGAIGQKVAKLAEAFDMNVLAYAPRPKDKAELKTVKFVTLDELLKESDIITCHCPLTNETKGMINEETITKMKKSAIFINTSRGPVVDEKALANASAFLAPPVGLEPTTLSVRNIVALLAWGTRNARCFFLLRAPLHLPQAARCSEPVNSGCDANIKQCHSIPCSVEP